MPKVRDGDAKFFIRRTYQSYSDMPRVMAGILESFMRLCPFPCVPLLETIEGNACVTVRKKDGSARSIPLKRKPRNACERGGVIGLLYDDITVLLDEYELDLFNERTDVLRLAFGRSPMITNEYLLGFADGEMLSSPVRLDDKRVMEYGAWDSQDHSDFMERHGKETLNQGLALALFIPAKSSP